MSPGIKVRLHIGIEVPAISRLISEEHCLKTLFIYLACRVKQKTCGRYSYCKNLCSNSWCHLWELLQNQSMARDIRLKAEE
ncbi:unnamed protein product [Prunus armeniaca]